MQNFFNTIQLDMNIENMSQPTVEELQAEIVELQGQNEKLQLTADHWKTQYRNMEALTKKLMATITMPNNVTEEEALRIILNR